MFRFLKFLLACMTLHIVPEDGMPSEQTQEANDSATANEAQTQETNPQNTPAPDADDEAMQQTITKDEAKLSLLQEEFNTMSDRLHDEFEELVEKNPKSIFSEDEIEILEVGNSLSAKNKLFRDKFEEFRTKKLDEKKQVIDGFAQELGKRKEMFARGSVAKNFAAANPDVDMTKLAEFIQEDLSPRMRKEILTQAGEDKAKFLELAAAEFKKLGGSKNESEEDELPPDLNSLSGTSASMQSSSQDGDAYLRQIGARR